jgi:hypothetical protein
MIPQDLKNYHRRGDVYLTPKTMRPKTFPDAASVIVSTVISIIDLKYRWDYE